MEHLDPTNHCLPPASHSGLTDTHRTSTHGPFRRDDYEIGITADFSKETNDHRKPFFALQPRLCQLEVKYGLFQLDCMWITKYGQSKDFYNLEDLCLFLDGLTTTSMDMTTSIPPSELGEDCSGTPSLHTSMDGCNSSDGTARHRGRDLERLQRPHGDRDQGLSAAAHHTQPSDRDKSSSPLKPTTSPD
ncbi:hypothetical protein NDU88_004757 [Pleurodeles waltl]|uniref:Uncharacterized protein n=1 Tax=Pleurodeles waltl TaxID=8319 RepID=A0AAV7MVH7_PLEWA|nr:hypothetical protein NDU88_004757 [Pleurodeles waltl]